MSTIPKIHDGRRDRGQRRDCEVNHCSTQATIALSVGEAENYDLVKTAAKALGMVAVGRDLGHEFNFADLGSTASQPRRP